jgi:competence protein ComGC
MKNMFNFDFDEMDRSQIKTFSLVAVLVFFIIVTILLILRYSNTILFPL